MKNKLSLLSTIVFLLFISCSGPSSLYDFDTPLTSDTANSLTTELTVNIPTGWFSAEDNADKKIDLWLIKDDYKASISFIRINPDIETLKPLGKNALKKIDEYSRLNNKLAYYDKYIDLLKNEVFELNRREFSAYQFSALGNMYRVVVFSYKGVYYECITSLKPGLPLNEQLKIYSIQNSVLRSIK